MFYICDLLPTADWPESHRVCVSWMFGFIYMYIWNNTVKMEHKQNRTKAAVALLLNITNQFKQSCPQTVTFKVIFCCSETGPHSSVLLLYSFIKIRDANNEAIIDSFLIKNLIDLIK